MKTVIGIDFGTSTTVVAKRTESSRFEPEIIEIEGKKTTDTVIRLTANGDRIESIGQDAWSAAEQYASTTFYEFKPHVGKGVSYPLPSGTQISAEDLAVRFLRRIREAIENFYGKSDLEARNTITIIGYPADWPEKQKDAIVKAAKDAGFPNVEGCIEPLAVLYYHHSRGDLDLNKPQKILVYDLGGGTTDTCLVEVTSLDQPPKVLGTGGEDTGGRHFDSTIANNLTQVICKEERIQSLSPEDTITIRKSGRTMKEKISDEARHGHDDFKYTVPPLLSTGRTFKFNITKSDFEKICGVHIKQLDIPIEEVLKRSAIEPSEIDRVVIAGGMGRLYFVRPCVEQRFPHLKEKGITTSTNPQEVVAKGLVLYGMRDTLKPQNKNSLPKATQRQQFLRENTPWKMRISQKTYLEGLKSKRNITVILFIIFLVSMTWLFRSCGGTDNIDMQKNESNLQNIQETRSRLSKQWQDYITLASIFLKSTDTEIKNTQIQSTMTLAYWQQVLFKLNEMSPTDNEIADIALEAKSIAQEVINNIQTAGTLENIDLAKHIHFFMREQALSYRLENIARRLAGSSRKVKEPVIEIDFNEAWSDKTSIVYLINKGKSIIENTTINVLVKGTTKSADNDISSIFFVDEWKPDEVRYYSFFNYIDQGYREEPDSVEALVVSLWTPALSQENLIFKYDDNEKAKDIEFYMKDFKLGVVYRPFEKGLVWNTERRVSLSFNGIPYLLYPIVSVSFVSGQETQIKTLQVERWSEEETLMFEKQPDNQYWKFDPEHIDVKMEFPTTKYTVNMSFKPGEWGTE